MADEHLAAMAGALSTAADVLSTAANDAVAPDGRAGNAWRHGMHARRIAFGSEELAGFEDLRAALVEQWRPRSVTAWMLVDRLARLQWKLMRAEESEIRVVEIARRHRRTWDGLSHERYEILSVDHAVANDLSDARSGLAKLQLFQMRLERSVHRTIALLLALRKLRGGQGKGRAAGAGAKTA